MCSHGCLFRKCLGSGPFLFLIARRYLCLQGWWWARKHTPNRAWSSRNAFSSLLGSGMGAHRHTTCFSVAEVQTVVGHVVSSSPTHQAMGPACGYSCYQRDGDSERCEDQAVLGADAETGLELLQLSLSLHVPRILLNVLQGDGSWPLGTHWSLPDQF